MLRENTSRTSKALRYVGISLFCGCLLIIALAPLCQAAQTATRAPSLMRALPQRPANKSTRKKPAPKRPTQQKTRPQDDPHGMREMDNFLSKVLTVIKYIVIGIIALGGALYLWFFLSDKVLEFRRSPSVARRYIKRSLRKLLESEASALAALDIPHPTLRTKLLTRKGNIHPPTFDIPPHLLFKVRQLADLPVDDPYTAHLYELFIPHLVYFIADDADTVERALQDFKTNGLHHVVASYEGVWLNRDPYALYRFLNEQEPLNTWMFCERLRKPEDERSKVERENPSTWPLPPLEEVDSVPADQLHKVERRAFLFYILTGDIIPQPSQDELYILEPVSTVIPDEIIYDLPLPPLTFPEECVTLKVLPHKDARAGLSVQFLESIRTVSCPVAFELIAEGGTMYFQFSCSPCDRDLIEHQLQTHFPGFAVVEEEKALAAVAPFHVLAARPFYPLRFLKTDFALDPYSQLLAVLTGASFDDVVCAQVIFSPVPATAFTMIARCLEEYSDTYRPSKQEMLMERWDRLMEKRGEGTGYRAYDPAQDINERLRELERKLPQPWLGQIRFFSTSSRVLDDLKRNFLHQYETPHQTWVVSDTATANAIFRRLDMCNTVSTQELAAFVHFPGKDIECDRLETVSMKLKLPPTLYIE